MQVYFGFQVHKSQIFFKKPTLKKSHFAFCFALECWKSKCNMRSIFENQLLRKISLYSIKCFFKDVFSEKKLVMMARVRYLSNFELQLSLSQIHLGIYKIPLQNKRPVFLIIKNLVRGLVWGFSNISFWIQSVLKQNIWDAWYNTSYKALNDKKYWALIQASTATRRRPPINQFVCPPSEE